MSSDNQTGETRLSALGRFRAAGLLPRLAVINATGANTLTELVNDKGLRWNNGDESTANGHPTI